LASFKTRLRLALDATLFTDLGILLYIFWLMALLSQGNFKPASGLNIKPLKHQHGLYIVHIRLVNQGLVAKSSLLLGFLLRQDVIFEGALMLNFTSARHFKTFLGS
jgi:hypothetical protein